MTSVDIEITNIQEEDIDEIIQMGLSTPELHVQDETPAYYSKDMLTSFIKSPKDIYLVTKINGEIAGYRLATYNPYLQEAYLIDMVVKPKYRRLGVAIKLYIKTFEILNKTDCQWIWVLAKERNEKIKEILKKQGFMKGEHFTLFYKLRPF